MVSSYRLLPVSHGDHGSNIKDIQSCARAAICLMPKVEMLQMVFTNAPDRHLGCALSSAARSPNSSSKPAAELLVFSSLQSMSCDWPVAVVRLLPQATNSLGFGRIQQQQNHSQAYRLSPDGTVVGGIQPSKASLPDRPISKVLLDRPAIPKMDWLRLAVCRTSLAAACFCTLVASAFNACRQCLLA